MIDEDVALMLFYIVYDAQDRKEKNPSYLLALLLFIIF